MYVYTMLRSSVSADYAPESSTAAANLSFNAGDFKLQASISKVTFEVGPTLSNLVLSLDNPTSFSINYNIPNQDLRFQFMNKGKLLEKELNLTYTHWRKDNRMTLDGTLAIDSKNKVSANYEIGTKNCKLKYSYVEGDDGTTIIEPCYDLANNCYQFSVSRHIFEDGLLKASYQSSTRVLGLEWSRPLSFNGSFKAVASLNLAEKSKIPRIRAESTWNSDM